MSQTRTCSSSGCKWKVGLGVCKKILSNEGLGHTAIIHTRSPELIERFGSEISASRILVNAGGS